MRMIFSRIALKDIFVRLKTCNKGQIYQRQSDLAISGGVYSHAYAKFHENKTLAKISEFTVYGISY